MCKVITSHDDGIPVAAWCCGWPYHPAAADQQNPSRWPEAECTVSTWAAAITLCVHYGITLLIHAIHETNPLSRFFPTLCSFAYSEKAQTSPLPRGTLMTISSEPPAMGEPFTEILYTFSLWRGTRTAGVLGNLDREFSIKLVGMEITNILANFIILIHFTLNVT